MSWIRSAMNRAAEVPGGAKLRAAVRTYTDTVVQHAGYAVVEGAKIFQDRIATRNVKSYGDAVIRLEELSVSCKGEERVKLLRRWLVSLREIKRLHGNSSVENDETSSMELICTSSDKNVTSMILYNEPDLGRSPMDFCDVFLQSQALEGVAMSMILQAPNEEEILLLHEIFGLCLAGGKEVHDVVVKSIQDLAKAFKVYDGEMLVRRAELLQFAQTAITGLKVTADTARIDSEILQIQQSLNRMKLQKSSGGRNENSSEATNDASSTGTKESVAHIQLCCRLKSLLLKKRLLKQGDTPETHNQKVDKLKVLSESLLNSASKTEKQILEYRQQKEEALSFRTARTSGVSQIEKDLGAEVSMLEKQRDKLEAELRKVNIKLAAVNARLQNAREERLQFDEDNDQFLLHLKTKEDELSETMVSYRAEADTCNAFVNFLEATWAFQSSYVKQRHKQVNDQLENHEEYLVNAASSILSTYKDQLGPAIATMRKHMESLEGYEKTIDPDEEFLQDIKRRQSLEQEYLDAKGKVLNIFDAVESIKEHFYGAIDDASRKGVEKVNELCDAIEKIKSDFKTIKRRNLRIQKPPEIVETPATDSPQGVIIPSPVSIIAQRLISPRNKPYIPLGGASEKSPFSTQGNGTKSSESKQHKVQMREYEKPSRPDKDVPNLALEFEDETLGHGPTAKTDQAKFPQPSTNDHKTSSGLDKESKEQLTVAEIQETKMHKPSTLEPDKDLAKLILETETGVNAETAGSGQGKTTEPSTGNGKKLLDSNDKTPKLVLAAEELRGNNNTTETVHGKTSELSTGDGKKLDPYEKLPKSTSRTEEDELSTEEVDGWEFDGLVNDLKDDNPLS